MVHSPDSADVWSASPLTVSAAAKVLGTSVLLTQLDRVSIPADTTAATAICPVLGLISSRLSSFCPWAREPIVSGPTRYGSGLGSLIQMEGATYLPDTCGIPEFDDLDQRQIVSFATKTLVEEKPFQLDENGPDRQRLLNLVRLMDRTIVDFELARASLQVYIAQRYQGNLSGLFISISHVEAGVTAFARALTFAEWLMRSKYAPAIAKDELPPKTIRDSVRAVRNKIEHYDEEIAHGNVPTETMPMLQILDNCLKLESESISWTDLDESIRKLHSLVARLIQL